MGRPLSCLRREVVQSQITCINLTTQSRGPPHGHGIQIRSNRCPCVGPLFWLLASMKHSVAIVFFLFAVLIALFFVSKPVFICDKTHPVVSLAKNLPQDKLAALFKEVENSASITKRSSESIIPLKTELGFDSLYSIKNSSAHYWADDYASVKLAACFDHSVSLALEDLNKPTGSITLYWGEFENEEQLLWTKSQ